MVFLLGPIGPNEIGEGKPLLGLAPALGQAPGLVQFVSTTSGAWRCSVQGVRRFVADHEIHCLSKRNRDAPLLEMLHRRGILC
jgi:hypothetical protein